MNFPQTRLLLWVGSPCRLLRVRTGLFRARALAIEEGPALTEAMEPGQVEALQAWLRGRTARAGSLDIVYERHLFRVESFPSLARADRDDALAARLRHELLISLQELAWLAAWTGSPGKSQAVFAAVLASAHRVLVAALAEIGLTAARVGYAAQLAAGLLTRNASPGAWTLLENAGDSGALALALGVNGDIVSTRLSAGAGPAVAREALALRQPRAPFASGPLSLGAGPDLARRLAEVFAGEPHWRAASREEAQYPYVFAARSWVLAAFTGLLAVHGQAARLELGEREAAARRVSQLAADTASLEESARRLAGREQALDTLRRELEGLDADPFDNAAWLAFVAGARDRCAASLLFDSLSFRGSRLTLTGSPGSLDPVLRLHECLAASLGRSNVRIQRLDSEKAGLSSFVMQLDRPGPIPPRLPDWKD